MGAMGADKCVEPTMSLLGETCDNSCLGYCDLSGSDARCNNNRCERRVVGSSTSARPGIGCMCDGSCGANMACDYNATRAASLNVCRFNSVLPAGAKCTASSECVGSQTCDNGVCTGRALNDLCSLSVMDCAPPAVCITEEAADSTVTRCLTPRTAGAKCIRDADCQSASCDTSKRVCVERFSVPAGGNCTSDAACESHHCGTDAFGSMSPGRCSETVRTRGAGGKCPNGDINCQPGHLCIGTEDKECADVRGIDCLNGASCGNGACSCAGSSLKCFPRNYPPAECDAAKYDLFAAVPSYVSTPISYMRSLTSFAFVLPYNRYPSQLQDLTAKYFCCLLTKGSIGYNEFINTARVQAFASTKLDCKADPPVWIDVDAADPTATPKRCTLTERLTVDDLVVGGNANSAPMLGQLSAASAVAPSLVVSALAASLKRG
ncbi:hypothetical protein, variant [Thecamonas trahens ATCC 50062]|uniref:Uncharacterized protein n=1 Tax=Thecamonas trahens ATCC 50062 TaxID=461836 RepID=A0A0L0DKL5_THETB|nr:hypothetical protein, variant [Thecamonas trahens ATCC 50062]KNC52571.1 hypothetical protein, variant [Thecamonas trahens ATCC 50062]|eukprot:XP_013755362.1 hypothetical protein, variant [Thecamonas trahens ATCC 50062]